MEAVSTEEIQWAYVCGGYPGRIAAIKLRLLKLGINMSGHCDDPRTFHVPKQTTFILVIADQCSHAIRDKASEAAERLDLPYVGGNYKNWVNLEARLTARNLVGRKMELVGGGQELIPIQPEAHATIGDTIPAAKLAELRAQIEAPCDKIVHSPDGIPLGRCEVGGVHDVHALTMPRPSTVPLPVPTQDANMVSKKLTRSADIKEAVQRIFKNHANELTTYTSTEAALEVSKLLGKTVHVSTVSTWRKRLKIAAPPAGFKKAKRGEGTRYQGSRAKPSIAERPTAKPLPVPAAPLSDDSIPDFDTVQSLLDELVVKNQISSLYVSYTNGEWDVTWDRVRVVSGSKKYKR